ncbi:MAG: M28 family peptidase [Armatimonadota bacterium]
MIHKPFVVLAALTFLAPLAAEPAFAQKPSVRVPPGPRLAAPGSYLTAADARALADRAISAAQLKDYLSFIASDELQGRDTPSNGLNTAAKFLATNLARWGFKPAGDAGTFFQKIALNRSRIDPATTTASLGGKTLAYPADFVLSAGRGRGAVDAAIAETSLVYVGQGWVLPQKGVNPYNGLNVKGKFLVVSQRLGQRFPGGPDYANAIIPQQYAAQQGAAGIVYLSDAASFAPLRNDAATPRGGFTPASASSSPARQAALPTVILSPEASQQLFAGEKIDSTRAMTQTAVGADQPSFELASAKKMSLTLRYQTETMPTQNVVAIWEGSDPRLKSEYVAFGAHYDHVGMSATPDASGDSIFNGADDDGSGTSALLAMADALHQASTRPRRSLLFVWHCGEEKGLWGSSYFTENPTVPLNKVAAQLNIDMIGRSKQAGDQKPANASLSGPKEIFVIGSRMMSTQLGNLSDQVNKSYLNLKLNYTYDDPNDPNQFFYRSDHINYARKGIPIIFWFDGVHEDYHRRSDEVSKIDFEKMTMVTRTVLVTAAEIANLPEKLVVDKKLTLPAR